MDLQSASGLVERLRSDAEEMLAQGANTDEAIREVLAMLADAEPHTLREKSDGDLHRTLIFATLGLAYLLRRRAEAAEMEER